MKTKQTYYATLPNPRSKRHQLSYADCRRLPACRLTGIDVFTRQTYRDILIESLDFCRREKVLMIFAYVIMSNHVHLIAQAREDARQDLSGILGDFKKYTSKKIIKAIETGPESRREWLLHMFRYYAKYNTNNREHQFWIQDNHPILLYSPPVIWQKVQYTHRNPVRANIVDDPLAYLYSSARNYMFENKNCLLEIDLLEPWLPGSY